MAVTRSQRRRDPASKSAEATTNSGEASSYGLSTGANSTDQHGSSTSLAGLPGDGNDVEMDTASSLTNPEPVSDALSPPNSPTLSENRHEIIDDASLQSHNSDATKPSIYGVFPIEIWLNIITNLETQDLLKMVRLNETWLNFIAPLLYEDIHAIVGFGPESDRVISVDHLDFPAFSLLHRNIVLADFSKILSIFENILSNPNSILRRFYKSFKIDIVFTGFNSNFRDYLKTLEIHVNSISQSRGDDKINHVSMPHDLITKTRFFRAFMSMQASRARSFSENDLHSALEDHYDIADIEDDDFFFNLSARTDRGIRYFVQCIYSFDCLNYADCLLERFVKNINIKKSRPSASNLRNMSKPTSIRYTNPASRLVSNSFSQDTTLLANSEAYVDFLGLREEKPIAISDEPENQYKKFQSINKSEIDRFINLVGGALSLTNCDEEFFSVMFAGSKSGLVDFRQPGISLGLSYPYIFNAEAGRPKK